MVAGNRDERVATYLEHGLLKRAANTYRYYLTRSGRLAIAAFERVSTFAIVPAMARA